MRRYYAKLDLFYTRGSKSSRNAVHGFTGDHAFLSNFYMKSFVQNGVRFSCSEQSFMYQKSTALAYRKRLMSATNARECKRIGRQAVLASDWDDKRYLAMYKTLLAKFADPELKAKLLATGNAYLEETNHWRDFHWGRCNGVGQNHLGRLLMCVRHYYRSSK